MILAGSSSRSPPAVALLVLASIFQTTIGHALPRQTKTVEYRELDVLPWPLATAAPLSPDEFNDLQRREYNTVCGYLGGDPALPATCSAGSHCAVDVNQGAIGCCPDGGSCTQGIYTGCVDANSGPQMEINPYVYTCKGSNVCYKNNYAGGYYQYGCGSASNIATTVLVTAFGESAVGFTSISAALTAAVTTLSEPTTLGTQRSTSSDSSTETDSSASSTETESKSSSTSSGSSTTDASSTASSTKTDTTVSSSSTSTSGVDAPATDEDDNKTNTGAILGGTISGVAALVALAALGMWLWRRKKGNTRQGPGAKQDEQYVSPVSQNRHNFAPLPSTQEGYESGTIRAVGIAHTTMEASGDHVGKGTEPFEPNYPYGYGPGSTAGGIAAIGGSGAGVGRSSHLESDEVPLTRESDDFSPSYGHALDRIDEDDNASHANTSTNADTNTSPNHPGPYKPLRDGGGALWQQNRGATRNLTWL